MTTTSTQCSTQCAYRYWFTNHVTGEKRAYHCTSDIDLDRIPPYRRGQGVCHRHERVGMFGVSPQEDGWPSDEAAMAQGWQRV